MADTFLGQSITDMINQTDQRYFYGLAEQMMENFLLLKLTQPKGKR